MQMTFFLEEVAAFAAVSVVLFLLLLFLVLRYKQRLYYALQEQGRLKNHIEALTLNRAELQKNLADLCNQALTGAQTTFLSSLSPVLARLQDATHHHFQNHTAAFQNLTTPLAKTLQDMTLHMQHIEQTRAGAYEGLREQVAHLMQGQQRLHTETNNLVTALRTPHIRGCWGEMQLRRVVELSGMSAYCDFQEQATLEKGDKRVRPDLIIRLTDNKCIIVDAKAPVLNYLEAVSAETTQEYQDKLKDHARLLLTHIKQLSEKQYWAYENYSQEFVLLFLPGEVFLSAALQVQPDLLEIAAERGLILATPIILIALLKTIAQGWRHQHLSENASRIVELGKQLYQSVQTFEEHFAQLGKALQNAESSYQRGARSLAKNLVPLAQELGNTGISLAVVTKSPMEKALKKQCPPSG